MRALVDHGEELAAVARLTPAELAEVTSSALGGRIQVTGVRCVPYDHHWGSPATAGLWHVSVAGVNVGGDGPVCYDYFVKLLRHTRLWPGLRHMPGEHRDEFASCFPWRFELDMHESGIGAVLPEGMRTPVLHHVKQADEDHVALWWEHITVRDDPWSLTDYARAARCLGRLAARRREGAEVNKRLPPRWRDSPPGAALRGFAERRVMLDSIPALGADRLWRHPAVASALARAGDPSLPADLLDIADRLPAILDRLDTLPQTFAHGDASPQNLLRPAGEPDTVVVIDWGFGTLLAVGFDLGQLLVSLAHAGQVDPSELRQIDKVIFPAYLEGLSAEGFDVDPGQVRAGYLGSLTARSALSSLPVELLGDPADEGVEEAFLSRIRLTRVLLDLAAEI